MRMHRNTSEDFNSGMSDKKSGYYDKWYRWNRLDDGQAYDAGFQSVDCNKEEIQIIECVHN